MLISFLSSTNFPCFRNDKSKRLSLNSSFKEAKQYFEGASEEILKVADAEALQYLFDSVDGKMMPLITTAFWGTDDNLFTVDTFEKMYEISSLIHNIKKHFLENLPVISLITDNENLSNDSKEIYASIVMGSILLVNQGPV